MKKPKPVRKAIREKKHEQRLASNASFQEMLKSSASATKKKTAK